MRKALKGLVLILVGIAVVSTPTLSFLFSESIDSKDDKIDTGQKEEIPKEEKPTVIKATIEIHPYKINCKSKGVWVTAYIGLPSSYHVNEIVIETILLDDTICAQTFPYEYVDIDNDGSLELMAKFDRADLLAYLTGDIESQQFYNIIITANLGDGTKIQGSCVTELIHYS